MNTWIISLLSSEWTFIISAPDIETGFLPWLMEEVSSTLEQRYVARTVLDSELTIFRELFSQIKNIFVKYFQLSNT